MNKFFLITTSLLLSNIVLAGPDSISCIGKINEDSKLEISVHGPYLEEHDFVVGKGLVSSEEFTYQASIIVNGQSNSADSNEIIVNGDLNLTSSTYEPVECGVPTLTENFNLPVEYKNQQISLDCTIISYDYANRSINGCDE